MWHQFKRLYVPLDKCKKNLYSRKKKLYTILIENLQNFPHYNWVVFMNVNIL